MANIKLKLSGNVEGPFFVDETCIDCDACRKFAPSNFIFQGGYSVVSKQPENDDELLTCQKALISCPVNSIGDQNKSSLKDALDDLPTKIEGPVYLNGFNSDKSFGADTYFIRSDQGNWLVDSPEWNPSLVKRLEELGGLKYIFLTHKDDVADAKKYAEYFGAERIMHKEDINWRKKAEIVLEGDGDWEFDLGVICYTPGHTKGHCCLIYDQKYLFTGDHFSWSEKRQNWNVFVNYCWYDLDLQFQSVKKLEKYPDVEWILPGHGRRNKINPGDFPKIIRDFQLPC